MQVYELIDKLMKMPAGARVFVETKKPLDELLEDNLLGNEGMADISFPVKLVGKRKEEFDVIILF